MAAVAEEDSIERHLQTLTTKVEKDVESIYELAQKTNSTDALNIPGTVTADLALLFTDIPADTARKIRGLQSRILRAFEKAAQDMEEERRIRLLSVTDVRLMSQSLPAAAAMTLETVVSALGENNASILRVHLAMQVFENINNKLIDEATTTQDPMRARALYMQQAAHVYEISHCVLRVLGQDPLTAMVSLTNMKEDSQSRIYRRLAAINLQRSRLRDEVRNGNLSDENGRRLERSYVQIIRVNQTIADVWSQLLDGTLAQREFFKRVPVFVSQVQQKQQLAKFQLETLRDVLIIGEGFAPLEYVEGGMRISNLPLLELDQSSLLQLISGAGGLNAAK